MKIKTTLLNFVFVIALLLTACSKPIEYKGTFSFEPEKPKAGEKILVKYDPVDTQLEQAKDIEMFVYQFSVDVDDANQIKMKKEGKGWVGEFTALNTSKGIIIRFAEGETEDNNNMSGYLIKTFGEDGNEVAGIQAGLAVSQYFWGRRIGLERKAESSISNFESEFSKNPLLKSEFLDQYLKVVFDTKGEKGKSIIEKELSLLDSKQEKSEQELGILANWYDKIENTEKAAKYEKLVLNEYPKGKYAEEKLVSEIQETEAADKKKNLLVNLEKEFPNSKQIFDLYDEVARAYRNAKEYKKAKSFLEEGYGKIHPYYYNSIAFRWLTDNGSVDDVKSILEMGIKFAGSQLTKPTLIKSKTDTKKQFLTELKYYQGLNQFTLGKLYYENGNKEKSVELLSKGVDNTVDYYPQQEFNELYVKALIETGKHDEALLNLESFISGGKGSSEMMKMLKKAYTKKYGSSHGFKEYSEKFEAAAKELLIEKLKKEIIEEPAPQFTLTDLDGKEVSLSDYKGKTVMVDFWATWCGPCLKSFPGIKNAVEKYKDDENVKFLFVNSWERVENKKENAADFIAKNNYPFHVLMDEENVVIELFKVSGIPTKFIIDKNGNVRFKSVGFSGNIDQLVTEIDEMIAMVK